MRPMNDKTLSSKERAFLEAARRTVQAKAPGSEVANAVAPGARRAPPAASPLDATTVAGWDHPAAQAAPPQPEDEKWARIAALMERERRDAEAGRRRARRTGLAAVGVLVLLLLVVFARSLIR
jgi:hypothetical protein